MSFATVRPVASHPRPPGQPQSCFGLFFFRLRSARRQTPTWMDFCHMPSLPWPEIRVGATLGKVESSSDPQSRSSHLYEARCPTGPIRKRAWAINAAGVLSQVSQASGREKP